jgi:hypothetical protein
VTLEDTALFTSVVRVFAVEASWTFSNAASYVAGHLDSARKRDLVKELELAGLRQLAGEEAAVRLVDRAVYPTRQGRRLARSDDISRATHWPSTAIHRASSTDTGYVALATTSMPDRGAIGALADVLSRWSSLLRNVAGELPGAEQRASRLERSRDELRGRSTIAPDRWSDSVARRWGKISAKDAALVTTAVRRLVRPMTEHDAATLATLLGRDRAENENALLEATAGITIALAAARSPGWAVERDARHASGGTEPEIRLRGPNLMFRVLKGRPKDPGGKESLGSYRAAIVASLGLASSGGQPDHVLTFWKLGQPTAFVTVLADAKRNTAGKSYLSSSVNRMLAYCVEYAKWLGFTVSAEGGPTATLLPAATLFAWDLEGRMKAAGSARQLMAAFDRADMVAAAQGSSRVSDWFVSLAEQAELVLADGSPASTEIAGEVVRAARRIGRL